MYCTMRTFVSTMLATRKLAICCLIIKHIILKIENDLRFTYLAREHAAIKWPKIIQLVDC